MKFKNYIVINLVLICSFHFAHSQKPSFPKNCNSLLSKYLTDDVWEKLKSEKDSVGYSFRDFINSGVANTNSSIGVYAGSEDSYTKFSPLLDKIIEEYHDHKTESKHLSDWNVNKLSDIKNLDPEGKFCISTRIRVARNFANIPLGTCISKNQRETVENLAKEAFSNFNGLLKGKYFSLETMDKQVQSQLIKNHFLFKEGDKYLSAAGLNRDWPKNRGIYHNDEKTFLVWCNEEDHLRVISMQEGGDIKQVFIRLSEALKVIEAKSKFAYNDHLGYITTCPTNCGTAMRASIHVKLPKLSKNKKIMKDIADKYHVQIRGIDGEHSESNECIFDISNKRRLGFSEVQLVIDMYNGVKAMIEKEKSFS